mgnify:CR=1 FL=1
MIFVDTNIYFYARDARYPAEQATCQAWLIALGRSRRGMANLQVANEFVHVVRRKLPGFPAEQVFAMADEIMVWGDSSISVTETIGARRLHAELGYSWWDCLLIASALELGCTHFLSEDLQDGQRIEAGGKALTIVSPFAHTPDHILSPQG